MINLESIPIRHPLVTAFSEASLPLPGGGSLSSSAVVMLIALVAGIALAHFTSFGADVYAIGGDRTSAALMGAPLRRRTIQIYAVGGAYSALAGVIYAFYASSGYPLAGTGNELSAIAAVVLGGTLLTGAVGMVAGMLFGGMILGLIATLINFNGSLNGAWIMILSGALLFVFIIMQRALVGVVAPRGGVTISKTRARGVTKSKAAAGSVKDPLRKPKHRAAPEPLQEPRRPAHVESIERSLRARGGDAGTGDCRGRPSGRSDPSNRNGNARALRRFTQRVAGGL